MAYYLRLLLKLIIRTILFFVLLIVLYVVVALIGSSISVGENNVDANDVVIYLKTNGVHTDIVVPVKSDEIDWSMLVKYNNTASNDTSLRFLSFGWGDKGFYLETPTWSDLKFKTAFKAAFGLSTSAMHTTFYKKMQLSSDCIKIYLTKEQYHQLINYIRASFCKNRDGHFVCINTKANYGMNDAFYEANGSYSMFTTCNTWANNALKRCNQKCCWWTPFDKGIFYHYR